MKKLNVECGKLLELDFKTTTDYNNPFADIDINCTFISPSKREVSIPAFYDGNSTWRVRFTPRGWEIGNTGFTQILKIVA